MTTSSYDAAAVRGHRALAIRVNSIGGMVAAPRDQPVRVGTIDTVPTTLEPVQVDEPDLDEDTAADRPWIVLVWNDPINLMSYVTHVFQKLFGYSLEKATALMLDVHEKGRAVVASGTREEAEMHVFRLHEHSLWATMEHDT
jgi:ATP-dependent Clp protease adaptor protein ClpS